MIAALSAVLASLAAGGAGACLVVEVSAVGHSGHGATVMLQAAPHRLIRALDRLPRWVDSSGDADSARIVDLDAAPAVNVIPSRATGRVEVVLNEGSAEPGTVIEKLQLALGNQVEAALSADSCAGDPSVDAGGGR